MQNATINARSVHLQGERNASGGVGKSEKSGAVERRMGVGQYAYIVHRCGGSYTRCLVGRNTDKYQLLVTISFKFMLMIKCNAIFP